MNELSKGGGAFSKSAWGHVAPITVLLLCMVIAYHEIPYHSLLINWDDQDYITKNPAIRSFSLQNLWLAFTSYYVGNYAPVQIVSYMLDYSIWGLKPFGYLFSNLVYHFISGVLLYSLLIRMGFRKWGALLGSGLFLVHPVQVECVAWASQRKTLLAMLFFLLAFHSWLTWRERKCATPWKWYAASLLLFALSLLAKSVAVIFPVMLVLYDLLVMPARHSLKAHADKLPYLCAATVVGILAILTQVPEYSGGRVNYPDNPLYIPLTMLPVLAGYLAKLFWPDPATLCIMYFPPTRTGVDAAVVFSSMMVLGLVLCGIYQYRKNRTLLFWYCLFFLGLLPVSQIVPLVTLMNDRYLYFPLLGAAGVVANLTVVVEQSGWRPLYIRLTACIALLLLCVLGYTSHIRGKVWHDSISLFSDAVIKAPDNPDPWSRLAEGYVWIGNFDAARVYYEKSAALGVLDDVAKFNLAHIYLERGELNKAYDFINKYMVADEKFLHTRMFLGEYYFRIGAFHDAERQLVAYIEHVPDADGAFMTLGQVYVMLGKHDKAREAYGKAVKEGKNQPSLYYAMASLESMDNNINLSLSYLQKALALGFNKRDYLQRDPALDNVRRDPRFGVLVGSFIK